MYRSMKTPIFTQTVLLRAPLLVFDYYDWTLTNTLNKRMEMRQ